VVRGGGEGGCGGGGVGVWRWGWGGLGGGGGKARCGEGGEGFGSCKGGGVGIWGKMKTTGLGLRGEGYMVREHGRCQREEAQPPQSGFHRRKNHISLLFCETRTLPQGCLLMVKFRSSQAGNVIP